jgi:Kef-type K+ transport system membrane component KefB
MADLRRLADGRALGLGAALVAVGIGGKLASGLALRRFEGSRMVVGVAMIPRGEVGVIFAQVALTAGAIDPGTFGALLLMVVATTVVTPPWLAAITHTRAKRSVDPAGEGIGDLVSGARPMTPRSTQPVKRDYNADA